MASLSPTAPRDSAARYHGFSLGSVGWGYRDLFERLIESLLERGVIGPARQTVTATFFGLLRQADQGSYDHVLRHFLGAINPRTEWLLEVPAVFADVVALGRRLAAAQPHHGVVFFTILAEEGLGQTPEQVHRALTLAQRLLSVDPDLAIAFLRGYASLTARLGAADLERFVEAGLAAFARHPPTGLAFMQGTLASSEALICALAQECRLQDIRGPLSVLIQALVGHDPQPAADRPKRRPPLENCRVYAALRRDGTPDCRRPDRTRKPAGSLHAAVARSRLDRGPAAACQAIGIADLGGLPADEVVGRGCGCVLLERTLYLPTRMRRWPTRSRNQAGYTLAAVVAAATLRFDSFSRIHGHPPYLTLRGLVGDDPLTLNALLLAEWHRVLCACGREWPGVRRLLQAGLELEFGAGTVLPPLVRQVLLASAEPIPEPAARLVASTQACLNVFHTARLLTPPLLADLRRDCPELAREPLPPLSFMPDFLFPAPCTAAPAETVVTNLRRIAAAALRSGSETTALSAEAQTALNRAEHVPAEAPPGDPAAPAAAGTVYDEWSHSERDYQRGHCHLYETVPDAAPGREPPADVAAEARRVRRAFERLKPESVRREKYRREGDDINIDRLVHFVTQRDADPSPRVDFYEKPRVNRRDVAVLVLLDVSGSTGELTPAGERILDLERRAAMVLGQGLEALGDRFAICGFNSNGPRQCSFLVFKDFGERWDRQPLARLQAAVPANSTRVGPALRHAGWRLGRIRCRQRLILLITDGRPMDSGYDPSTHYAQADVRKAGEENARRGIHTFAVATAGSSGVDMEAMFPGHRFVILPDIRHLPRVLPRLYSRLTL